MVERKSDLHTRALSRLGARGVVAGASVLASDALAVLHALASAPETAADALALLHELQVHQVELDLQAEALRESRAELDSALRRQIELYDLQPVGCFTLDQTSVVQELNLTGASMLGMPRDDAIGLALDSFLAPASGWVLRELLLRVSPGAAPETSTLQLLSRNGTERSVRALACADPAGRRCLVVLTDSEEGRGAQARAGL